MRPLRTFEEVTIERFREDPKEAQAFLRVVLGEYQEDRDVRPLLSALALVAEAQGGTTELARRTKMSKAELDKRFSSRAKLSCNELLDIMQGLGYRMTLEPLRTA